MRRQPNTCVYVSTCIHVGEGPLELTLTFIFNNYVMFFGDPAGLLCAPLKTQYSADLTALYSFQAMLAVKTVNGDWEVKQHTSLPGKEQEKESRCASNLHSNLWHPLC